MDSHEHRKATGWLYFGKCWRGSKPYYPNGLHHPDCDRSNCDHTNETNCEVISGTNNCKCTGCCPGSAPSNPIIAADEKFYEYVEEGTDLIISLINSETKPPYMKDRMWAYNNQSDFEYGAIIGTLITLAQNAFQEKYKRTLLEEEEKKILEIIMSKIDKIKNNIK